MITLKYLMAFFMFYAFVGWCTEVIYKTVCTGKFVNRGFLNGPLCPIYGVGVTIVIICLTPLQDNLLLLYAGSFLLTSVLEFITGLVLEKIFHQKWWDYTEEHFNIMGYVCLRFSLAWGLACVFVMKVIQPLVQLAVDNAPNTVLNIIFAIFYSLMLADLIVTVAELAKIKKQLQIANDIDHMLNRIAEAVGTKLSSGTIKSMSELQEGKEKFNEIKEKATDKATEIKETSKNKYYDTAVAKAKAIEARYNAITDSHKARYGKDSDGTERLSFVHKRLEKAYPNLDFKRIGHINMSSKMNGLKAKLNEFAENIGNVKL